MHALVKRFKNINELRQYVDEELAAIRREIRGLEPIIRNYTGESLLHSREAYKEVVFKSTDGQDIFNVRIYYKANRNTEVNIISEAVAYLQTRAVLLEDFKNKMNSLNWSGPLLVLMVDSVPHIIILEKEDQSS